MIEGEPQKDRLQTMSLYEKQCFLKLFGLPVHYAIELSKLDNDVGDEWRMIFRHMDHFMDGFELSKHIK